MVGIKNEKEDNNYSYNSFIYSIFFAHKYEYKDGGSVEHKSLWYSVTKVHSYKTERERQETGEKFNIGTKVEILGFEVFDDVK